MAILELAACSSTGARPRSLLHSKLVAGAQVRGAATHRAEVLKKDAIPVSIDSAFKHLQVSRNAPCLWHRRLTKS
jgi:hypothetical protein